MKEKTYRKETFATLEDFVNEAKRLVKDKNNFKFINREKYDMCIAKMNINGVYGEAFGIMEDGRIILTHIVKYSVDRGTKKCYSFYRDERGVTNPELARKVERQRRKHPDYRRRLANCRQARRRLVPRFAQSARSNFHS